MAGLRASPCSLLDDAVYELWTIRKSYIILRFLALWLSPEPLHLNVRLLQTILPGLPVPCALPSHGGLKVTDMTICDCHQCPEHLISQQWGFSKATCLGVQVLWTSMGKSAGVSPLTMDHFKCSSHADVWLSPRPDMSHEDGQRL